MHFFYSTEGFNWLKGKENIGWVSTLGAFLSIAHQKKGDGNGKIWWKYQICKKMKSFYVHLRWFLTYGVLKAHMHVNKVWHCEHWTHVTAVSTFPEIYDDMTGGNSSNRNVSTTEETEIFLGFMNEIISKVSLTLTPLKSICQAVARATTYFVSGLYPLPLLHFIRSVLWCIAYSTIYQQNLPSSSTPTTSWKLKSFYLANFQKIAWTFRWKSSRHQRAYWLSYHLETRFSSLPACATALFPSYCFH